MVCNVDTNKSINYLCDVVLPYWSTAKGCDLSCLSSYLMPCGILSVIYLPTSYLLVVLSCFKPNSAFLVVESMRLTEDKIRSGDKMLPFKCSCSLVLDAIPVLT